MKKIANKKKELQRLRNHRFTDDDSQHIRRDGAIYWWIWGLTPLGARVCRGWYPDEVTATQKMYEKNIVGEVIPLRTSSQVVATRIFKEKLAEDPDIPIDTALQRVRHRGKGVDL